MYSSSHGTIFLIALSASVLMLFGIHSHLRYLIATNENLDDHEDYRSTQLPAVIKQVAASFYASSEKEKNFLVYHTEFTRVDDLPPALICKERWYKSISVGQRIYRLIEKISYGVYWINRTEEIFFSGGA
ncbi:hypothetical protein HYALB_00008633 [Hymenoscyphus albidus]|uniref:Uncharacterized protein n=1 Tax=Hymenoscyphus albidus TaxID=595503 RepID=A0A9N9PRQ5_9HELO|nr:hypothetical protein HYALB_00008633 [Hymenoscyphus albidus]